MQTAELVNLCIGRLKEKVTKLAIEEFPDDVRSYSLTHSVGAMLVRYIGSGYEQQKINNFVLEKRTARIEVVCVARTLMKSEGMYSIIDQCKSALRGYAPDGKNKIRVAADGYRDMDESVWVYSVTFNVAVLEHENSGG